MTLTSFYTALTGINNNSLAINVIGDNLANMNTVAFKAGSASFSELLAGMSGTGATGNPISFGLGATLNGINHNTVQGTINYTGNPINAAINGNGFFVVSIEDGQGYTRAGNFQFDKDGNLITADGFQLVGYMGVDGQIDNNGALSPIEIRLGQTIPAVATTNIAFNTTLQVVTPDPASTSDPITYKDSVRVYDSLGLAHELTVTYACDPTTGDWSWSATIPAADVGGAASDPPFEINSGDLTFDVNGRLDGATTNPTLQITGLADGAADMAITLNLLDADGNPLIMQQGSSSFTTESQQDGLAASSLAKVSIDSSGVIMGTTGNGESIALAQLAIATFPNVEGLQKYKGSTFAEFTSAGEPSIGIAGMGGRGTITGASLEQSNVDMAQEFINLIVAERAYQANSRVITTTDELYQEALNMKR